MNKRFNKEDFIQDLINLFNILILVIQTIMYSAVFFKLITLSFWLLNIPLFIFLSIYVIKFIIKCCKKIKDKIKNNKGE